MIAAMAVIPMVIMITVPESCEGASLALVTCLPFKPTTCIGGGGGGGGVGGGEGHGLGLGGGGGGEGGAQPIGRPSVCALFVR